MALENLSPLDADCSFAIWIDAICIEQENDIEKSTQVPHMGSIYSLASQVAVWLGPHNLVDHNYRQIDSLTKYIDFLDFVPPSSNFNEPLFSEQEQALWIAIASTQHCSWFQSL